MFTMRKPFAAVYALQMEEITSASSVFPSWEIF